MASGFYLYSTRNCSEDRAVFGIDLHGRALFAVDAHGAEDRDEVERNVLFAADGEIDVVALGGFVTRELDDHFVSPRGQPEIRGRAARAPRSRRSRYTVRARRIGRHFDTATCGATRLSASSMRRF